MGSQQHDESDSPNEGGHHGRLRDVFYSVNAGGSLRRRVMFLEFHVGNDHGTIIRNVGVDCESLDNGVILRLSCGRAKVGRMSAQAH